MEIPFTSIELTEVLKCSHASPPPHPPNHHHHHSEPFIIFSGGLSYDKAGRRHTLTIMHGKAITVLEMDYPIVEFMALCETPYNNGGCEPSPALDW